MAIINGVGRVGIRVTSGGSSGGGTDADAQAFITAASITDPTQISAVNTLVTGLKSNNLWTKMKAIYPVVGGNATAHSFNLKNTTQYQLSFSSGWTHSSTGMKPNGTSSFASTGIKVSDFTTSSIGMSVYLRTNTDGLFCDIGTIDAGRFQLLSSFIGWVYCAFPDSNVLQNGVPGNTLGLFSINRYSTTNRKVYKNGSLLYTATETMNVTPNTYDFKIGASGGSSITWYSPRQNSLTIFKSALTDSEESTLNTLVQAFQTTLGRQVV